MPALYFTAKGATRTPRSPGRVFRAGSLANAVRTYTDGAGQSSHRSFQGKRN